MEHNAIPIQNLKFFGLNHSIGFNSYTWSWQHEPQIDSYSAAFYKDSIDQTLSGLKDINGNLSLLTYRAFWTEKTTTFLFLAKKVLSTSSSPVSFSATINYGIPEIAGLICRFQITNTLIGNVTNEPKLVISLSSMGDMDV